MSQCSTSKEVKVSGFILTGKVKDVVEVLAALAELDWQMPNLLALLDCQVTRLS